MPELPLSGVRVLDLTWYTAGPYCTRLLADYGADVLKIERPRVGDPSRQMPPFYKDQPGLERSGLFLYLNTSKRSMTLDLKTARGKEVLKELVRKADVLVENFSPHVLPSLGLDYKTFRQLNPHLVMTSISNFGQSGPYRDWKGSDLTIYGMGGPMINTGHPDHEPLMIARHVPSFHVGATASAATSIALYGAETNGEGDHLDVTYFETLMGTIDRRSGNLLSFQYSGETSTRGVFGASPGSGIWPCADGYFFTTVLANRFTAMARMIGAEHLLTDPKWATPAARSNPERVDEFAEMVIAWMIERTKKQVRAECDKFGVYGGPINTVSDVLDDEHFTARSFFQRIEHPTTGAITYPGYSFKLHLDEPAPPRRRAPLLGEHTDQVLRDELGLSAREAKELRTQGVV
ncbi:MAG: CoA transferase [SAR202 cluster bacterium]|nr:CoA transferase [SAR202 cluster bacterium]